MFTHKDNFTEVIDIILYKYNSIDSKLWSLLKRSVNHKKLSDESILIPYGEIKSIIVDNFSKDIDRIQATGGATLHKEATSIYFIWKMIDEMPKLRWIKVTLNKNSGYNRVVHVDEIKTIKYSIKCLRGTFRTFDHFSPSQIPLVNNILYRSGILFMNEHFRVLRLSNMLSRLDNFLSENNTSEMAVPISVFIQELEDYEVDDPEVLLITDYESDI